MQVCLATLRPLNFFKRKKKKKKAIRLVEGFKKASFLKKILPDTSSENRVFKIKVECFAKRYRWRFFLKPVGLELDFL
jgi:hypothetical protein